jgi:hypothetical protein
MAADLSVKIQSILKQHLKNEEDRIWNSFKKGDKNHRKYIRSQLKNYFCSSELK